VLARVVNEAGPRAVVCGDFNIARESSLFGDFMAATGLADAFVGACPTTFRAKYLPAGATPYSTSIKAASCCIRLACLDQFACDMQY